jgi:hypothetical protein
MARYFLHLRDHVSETLDPEGVDLPGLAELKVCVIDAARDIIASDARSGLIDLRYRIDADDEGGATVFSLPFGHAVSVVPPG